MFIAALSLATTLGRIGITRFSLFQVIAHISFWRYQSTTLTVIAGNARGTFPLTITAQVSACSAQH